jgi:hypothetical protein
MLTLLRRKGSNSSSSRTSGQPTSTTKAFQLRVNAVLIAPPANAEIKDFPEKKRG